MKSTYRYSEEESLCFKRVRKGRGFAYLDERGVKIGDKQNILRIKNLVIPPMWDDVNICKFDDGHIQATGRDLKGRKRKIWEINFPARTLGRGLEVGWPLNFSPKPSNISSNFPEKNWKPY
jgi:hypothetical protein